MAGEIASAFVRIRPNMTGFKSETETGVRGAFGGVGKIIAGALAIGGTFAFAKDIAEGAASVQKSTEAIRFEFGRASESVVKFSETTAASLGISKQAAESTATRFGILFKNLGIGQTVGAQMTTNLEKLAGALAAIRGVNPADVLQRLPLVLAGNLRALKEMGFAIDQNQLKQEAWKLGLIGTMKDALTPAARAQAIYALAVKQLPGFLKLAQAHSHDFANVQRRLSAEWANAKDQLGSALLPILAKYGSELANWLQRMTASGKIQRDFNSLIHSAIPLVTGIATAVKTGWRVFQEATGWIGGVKTAMVALFAVMAVNKIRAIAGSIVNDLVNNGFKQLRVATEAEKAAYLESFGTMEVATIGLSATIKSALVTTGIGALIVAIGLVTGYVLTHWDQVKRYTVALAAGIKATWEGLKDVLIGIAKVIGGSMATQLTFPFRVLLEAASKVSGLLGHIGIHIGGGVKTALNDLKGVTTGLVTEGAKQVGEGGKKMADSFGKAWHDALRKQDVAKSPLKEHAAKLKAEAVSVTKGASDAAGAVAAERKAMLDKAKAAVDAAQKNLRDSTQTAGQAISTAQGHLRDALAAGNQAVIDAVSKAKTNLDAIGQKLADSLAKIVGTSSSAPGALSKRFEHLRDLIAKGQATPELQRQAQQIASQIQEQQATGGPGADIKRKIADLTDEFNKGQLGVVSFNRRIAQLLKQEGLNYKQAGKVLGVSFVDGFKGQLAALREQAAAIAAGPHPAAAAGLPRPSVIRPAEVLAKSQERIAAARHEVARAHLAEARKHTALLQKVAKAQGNLVKTEKQVNPNAAHAKTAGKTAFRAG